MDNKRCNGTLSSGYQCPRKGAAKYEVRGSLIVRLCPDHTLENNADIVAELDESTS